MAITSLSWSYGAFALFQGLLHNVFLLYHVEIFVSIYRIDKLSFWLAEILFLVWNSLNDPVFGWLSDHSFLTHSTSSGEIVRQRIQSLRWSSLFFVASFLLFWFSWGWPGVQLLLSLCAYDGFLTVMELQHSALLADLAVSSVARTRLNWYTSLCSALGSCMVLLSYWVWSSQSLQTFQYYCLLLAAIALVGFTLSVGGMKASCPPQSHVKKAQEHEVHAPTVSQVSALKQFIMELRSHRNFKYFAAMNLVQVFHCHFNSNFFPMFLVNLLGSSVSVPTTSVLLGLSFVIPHVNNLYFLWLCRRWGVYAVIRLLFILKLVLGIVMLLAGPDHVWLLACFIASNRVFTEGTCKLLNLVISDLVDEDYVLHRRQNAVSALMFGTSALLSKPGQTLAPLLGTYLLNLYTGHDVFVDRSGAVKGGGSDLRLGVFHLLVYVPIGCSLLQLAAWSQFNLHGKRLARVKSIRAGEQSEPPV